MDIRLTFEIGKLEYLAQFVKLKFRQIFISYISHTFYPCIYLHLV